MNIAFLSDKNLKSIEKRKLIVSALLSEDLTIASLPPLNDKQTGIVLEAMEEISQKEVAIIDESWLKFADNNVNSENNTLKREAARVTGNIAHKFPDKLENIIPKLLQNSENESTVIRWSSGYSLGRIVQIPKFANSDLFEMLSIIAENEQESGVKNQYLKGLKQAVKMRK
jgi:xylose isomerase